MTQVNPNQTATGLAKWLSLIILILAQLGILLDFSTMQMSAEVLTLELDASMPEIQFASATYAMLAASFMVIGGFTGLVIGWRLQFKIGLLLAIVGSTLAALSPNMYVFIIGGRGVMALGACLLIPSVLAHIPALYHGENRRSAFAIMATFAGVAATIAPIIQGIIIDAVGFSTAYLIVGGYFALVLVLIRFLTPLPISKQTIKIDFVGIMLSCFALISIIISLLMISTWGLITPLTDIQVLGYSPVIPLIAVGLLLLKCFFSQQKEFEKKNGSAIVPQNFITNKPVVMGFYMMFVSNLLLASVAFLVIIYLQFAVGLSAAKAGMNFSILALGMVIGSIITPKVSKILSTQGFVQCIFALLSLGILFLCVGAQVNSFSPICYVGLFSLGLTSGFLLSLAPIIVTGSLTEREAQQSGGAQATAKNFGGALGIAISGSVLLLSLTGNVQSDVAEHNQLSLSTQAILAKQVAVPFVSNYDSLNLMQQGKIIAKDIPIMSNIYAQARLVSFQTALYVNIFFALFGLWLSRHIPSRIE